MQKPDSPNSPSIKIVVLTGELSGEIHAYHLIETLKNSLSAEYSGMGSAKLRGAGVNIVYDYRNISVTGMSEIIGKLKDIREAYRVLKRHILTEKPSLVILVDFPGFNLRMAKFAKAQGIPVVYFIPPQIWAWRKSRIQKIRDRVDKVVCILPFEQQLYDEYAVNATYVGHPFLNTVRPMHSQNDFFQKVGVHQGDLVITILPGSRENEVDKHMPVLLSIVTELKRHAHKLTVLLPLAENIDSRLIDKYLSAPFPIRAFKGLTYDAIAHCDLAVASSGSVTLEAAILGTPTIVIYKISLFSYMLARMLVNVQHISLPNIIAGKEVFPEYIQQIDPEKIAEKALYMVNNGREKIKNDIETIRKKLGMHDSYQRAGDQIIQVLERSYGTLPKTSSIR